MGSLDRELSSLEFLEYASLAIADHEHHNFLSNNEHSFFVQWRDTGTYPVPDARALINRDARADGGFNLKKLTLGVDYGDIAVHVELTDEYASRDILPDYSDEFSQMIFDKFRSSFKQRFEREVSLYSFTELSSKVLKLPVAVEGKLRLAKTEPPKQNQSALPASPQRRSIRQTLHEVL